MCTRIWLAEPFSVERRVATKHEVWSSEPRADRLGSLLNCLAS